MQRSHCEQLVSIRQKLAKKLLEHTSILEMSFDVKLGLFERLTEKPSEPTFGLKARKHSNLQAARDGF